MENVVQSLLAAQINSLHSQDFNVAAVPSKEEAVDPQLEAVQMNWMIQKFYQDQLQLLQQLQRYQQQFTGNVAPPSPPGSSIADEQQQQQATTEDCTEEPQASSSDEEDQTPLELSPSIEACTPRLHQDQGALLGATSAANACGPMKAAHSAPGTTRLRFHPYEFRQRSHVAKLEALNLTEPVEVELKYHQNMARSFGDIQRDCTPEQKERRMRNTHAARISRAKVRAICELLEKESCDAAETNLQRKVRVAQKRMYVAGLLQLLGLPAKDLDSEWKEHQQSQTDSGDRSTESNDGDTVGGTAAGETSVEC